MIRLLALLCLFSLPVFAALPAPPRVKQPPSIVWGADRSITFQLLIPKAQSVAIHLAPHSDGHRAMERGDDGIWRTTFTPLSAGTYTYRFEIDGIWTADPNSAQVLLGHQSLRYTLLEIADSAPQLHDFCDVPHGTIRIGYYRSKLLGGALRRYRIYTPPGYDQESSSRYPLVLLLHGSNGSDVTFSEHVRIEWVMDNLIAEGRIRPAILVMPNGNHSDSIDPFPRTAPAPVALSGEEDAIPFGLYDKNNRVMVASYVEELIPELEKNLRLLPEREHRIVTGLSMGGDQAIEAGLVFPQFFGWAYPIAPGARMPAKVSSTQRYREILAQPSYSKIAPRWSIAAAKTDTYIENVHQRFLPVLRSSGVDCPLFLTDGAHDYTTARQILIDHVLPVVLTPVSSEQQPDKSRKEAAQD